MGNLGLSKKDVDELYRLHYTEIVEFIQKRIKNRQVSEDLAQDTFVNAYKARKRYKEARNVRGWLFTIARHLFLNHVNRQKQVQTLPEEIGADESRQSDPFTRLLDQQQEARHRELLDALPTQQRQCLGLYYDGLKYHEIAKKLKLNMNTVKAHIHKARASAKQLLKENPEPPPGKERP